MLTLLVICWTECRQELKEFLHSREEIQPYLLLNLLWLNMVPDSRWIMLEEYLFLSLFVLGLFKWPGMVMVFNSKLESDY